MVALAPAVSKGGVLFSLRQIKARHAAAAAAGLLMLTSGVLARCKVPVLLIR